MNSFISLIASYHRSSSSKDQYSDSFSSVGHTHYILQFMDPDKGFSGPSERRILFFFLVGPDSSSSEDLLTIEYSVCALTFSIEKTFRFRKFPSLRLGSTLGAKVNSFQNRYRFRNCNHIIRHYWLVGLKVDRWKSPQCTTTEPTGAKTLQPFIGFIVLIWSYFSQFLSIIDQ